jgi:PTS system nitrogen regulatory IIA component
MDLGGMIGSDGVIPSLKAGSKKQAIEELAVHAARLTGLDRHGIFDTLLQRERLGSTGVGSGIAIPHGKMDELDGIFTMFAKLDEPVDFDSLDDTPVDLIFVLLAPESAGADHLKALARLSRLLREPSTIEKLRNSKDAETMFAVLTEPAVSAA